MPEVLNEALLEEGAVPALEGQLMVMDDRAAHS
jgi:hypothetical protein